MIIALCKQLTLMIWFIGSHASRSASSFCFCWHDRQLSAVKKVKVLQFSLLVHYLNEPSKHACLFWLDFLPLVDTMRWFMAHHWTASTTKRFFCLDSISCSVGGLTLFFVAKQAKESNHTMCFGNFLSCLEEISILGLCCVVCWATLQLVSWHI